jgi:hypothetical protein
MNNGIGRFTVRSKPNGNRNSCVGAFYRVTVRAEGAGLKNKNEKNRGYVNLIQHGDSMSLLCTGVSAVECKTQLSLVIVCCSIVSILEGLTV